MQRGKKEMGTKAWSKGGLGSCWVQAVPAALPPVPSPFLPSPLGLVCGAAVALLVVGR